MSMCNNIDRQKFVQVHFILLSKKDIYYQPILVMVRNVIQENTCKQFRIEKTERVAMHSYIDTDSYTYTETVT